MQYSETYCSPHGLLEYWAYFAVRMGVGTREVLTSSNTLLVGLVPALADDLPTNLLLKCEGNMTLIIQGGATALHREEKFDTILRQRTEQYRITPLPGS